MTVLAKDPLTGLIGELLTGPNGLSIGAEFGDPLLSQQCVSLRVFSSKQKEAFDEREEHGDGKRRVCQG